MHVHNAVSLVWGSLRFVTIIEQQPHDKSHSGPQVKVEHWLANSSTNVAIGLY